MQSFTRFDICNHHLQGFTFSKFLEIGIKSGRGGQLVEASIKLGIDPYPTKDCLFYNGVYKVTSDFFFDTHTSFLNLHVVLIDGLHHADQVMRDVINSLKHLNKKGTIVLHDCNPLDEDSQIVPRPKNQVHWNGDCWKVITRLRATRADLKVYTLDTDEGLGIIQFSKNEKLITIPDKLTWKGLQENRVEWLGLQQ